MWFMEEVGELATALQESNGEGNSSVVEPAGRGHLEEEFADVLAWLCTLANINEIDLVEAVTKKYLTGRGPVGHK